MRPRLVLMLATAGLLSAAAVQSYAAPSAPSQAYSLTPSASPSVQPGAAKPGPEADGSMILPSAAAPPATSRTVADCQALAAQVQAGQMKNPPKNCVAIEPIVAPMVDWPEKCSATVSSTTPWMALDRRNGCNHTAFIIVVINLANGEELGRSVIHTAMKMIASTTDASWSIPVDVRVASSTTPIGRPTITTGTFVVCPTNCVASNLSYGAVTTSYWKGSLTLSAKEMIQGSWRDHVGGYWRITFDNPGWVGTTSSDLTTADSRCDNGYGGVRPGCVFPTVPATVSFKRSVVPEFVNHVSRATLSGLPGLAGSDTYLHRLFDQALQDKNGNTACPQGNPPRPEASSVTSTRSAARTKAPTPAATRPRAVGTVARCPTRHAPGRVASAAASSTASRTGRLAARLWGSTSSSACLATTRSR